MIQEKRLVDEFLEFVKVGSESSKEGKFCNIVAEKLRGLGAQVFLDKTGEKIGSDGSNIIAKIDGDNNLPAILLNAHLDTVTPGINIKPTLEDGIIKSDGTTILGADDKSGIAIILEVSRVLIDEKISHPPIEVVFTLSEEIGLLGVKNLDYSLLHAKYGYSLDTHNVYRVTTSAPSHNKIYIKIYGVESHAGASPEQGISAIELAGKAISRLKLGRIDEETTSNIGKIKGGTATNIVAGYAELEGEARSHKEEKLEQETNRIINAFKDVAQESEKTVDGKLLVATIKEKVSREYNRFNLPVESPVVQRAIEAGKRIGLDIQTEKGGGGSDANIFNEKGIPTCVIGTGMQKVHTKEEFIKTQDLVLGAKLLLEILSFSKKA
ncbi:M20/M25/M40 family metallo-hydrolase [candidate division WOR-3 bacterium]|nr:M20/M25/M40 family metallo-hydrolase [candidate division WOR-3 bacterium]